MGRKIIFQICNSEYKRLLKYKCCLIVVMRIMDYETIIFTSNVLNFLIKSNQLCEIGMDEKTATRKGRYETWCEVFAVIVWQCFLYLRPWFLYFTLGLLFTRLWAVSLAYFIWIYIDRETPSKGGRR